MCLVDERQTFVEELPVEGAARATVLLPVLERVEVDHVDEGTRDRLDVDHDGLDERRQPVDAALNMTVEEDEYVAFGRASARHARSNQALVGIQADDSDQLFGKVRCQVAVQWRFQESFLFYRHSVGSSVRQTRTTQVRRHCYSYIYS